MVFATALVNLFLASTFAGPFVEGRLRPAARDQSTTTNNLQIRNPQYSPIWAGAVMTDVPGTFTYVSGVFTIPDIPLTNSSFVGVAVGIDGISPGTGGTRLQAGLDVVNTDGVLSLRGWSRWFPANRTEFTDISFNVNDTVRLSVLTSSSNSGSATIEILTPGRQHSVTQPVNSTSALHQADALWIVDYTRAGPLADLANFGTIVISEGLAASATKGIVVPDAENCRTLEMEQAKILTYSFVDDSGVNIRRIYQ